MGKVCLAPGCKSGYKAKGNEGKKRRSHMFPKDESLRQLWTKAPESTDSNPSRSDRSGKSLCLKILKKDAVPSNFPIFLTTIQKTSSKAFLTSTSSSRLLNENERILKKIKAFEEANSF
ncbi:Putative LOC100212901 [Caligus rogercresseyi]|uniref:LOC100212901 n=1 Tax=Caligus rogercresseyi TaxID=217165 RepID=A0A7T8KEA4_CALRO|nr:Putative LOC100212901 [Caligus rogercresseyi]